VRVHLPDARDTAEVVALYGRSARPPRRPDGRPWVMLSMVASADGAVVVQGSSASLSSPTDHQVLLTLRDAADAILVGAGTVRADNYGPPARRDLRVAVVTRDGNLEYTGRLFSSGAAVVVTTEGGPVVPEPITVIRAGRGRIDLAQALVKLGAGVVLSEGGPQLNAQLIADDLVDELCLTTSPLLVGGNGPRVSFGPFGEHVRRMKLAHLASDDGNVFARYVRA
jgi:riboflavin biosynthesis pyrimidine reductase